MDTHFLLTSASSSPIPGELNEDEDNEDFINPGIYDLEFAKFLAEELAARGYPVRFRCQEDWGHNLELEHGGKFTLSVGYANTEEKVEGEAPHSVFLHPDKPIIRMLFNETNVRDDVERLSAAVRDILDSSPMVRNLKVETTV